MGTPVIPIPAGDELAQLVAWRRDLHRIPELAHEEHETAHYLQEALRELGLRPVPVGETTGIYVDMDSPTPHGRERVLWRADMDGLPLVEATGLPFSSQHPGVMHACGHDGHMAIALGLARWLCAHPAPVPVRILFQPAEERHPGGALPLMAAGVLDGVGLVLGLHLWAGLPPGTVAIPGGPVTANSDRFTVTFTGRGGHGAAPHEARDAVVAAAECVVALQTLRSRRLDPRRPAVITVGHVEAGVAMNVIAETARLRGTVRTADEETRGLVEEALSATAEGVARRHGMTVQIEYTRGYPAVVNHRQVSAAWEAALPPTVRAVDWGPALIGEDFAYYLRERPGAFAMVGARPATGFHPHHAPAFDIDEEALLVGLMVAVAGIHAGAALTSGATPLG